MPNLKPDIKIAGELTVGCWLKLLPKLKKGEQWNEGVLFFRNRFEYRFLKPIELILKEDKNKGEGFTAMAIMCLLLETLQAFKKGAIFNNKNQKYFLPNKNTVSSAKLIRSFLMENEPFKKQMNNSIRKKFFSEVRCGLLHEARTKSDWIILAEKNDAKNILYEKNEFSKVLYRTTFFKFLKKAKEDYETKLLSDKDENLKENFLLKFNEICRK